MTVAMRYTLIFLQAVTSARKPPLGQRQICRLTEQEAQPHGAGHGIIREKLQ